MGSLRIFLALSVFALTLLYIEAAPATDFLGPPRSLEDDTDVNPIESAIPLSDVSPNRNNHEEEVTADERFYRTYENGTIEFKTALSNGHIQYQRISNKIVDGRTIQVYEGYISQRYADGRYGTSYYIADENGYRRTRVEVDTRPPVLPQSGPQKSIPNETKYLRTDTVDTSKQSALEDDLSIDTSKDIKRQAADESELPIAEEDIEDKNLGSPVEEQPTSEENEISTELPAQPKTEENVVKAVEDLESVVPTTEEIDASHRDSSTEVPFLRTTEENIVKAIDDEHLGATPVLTTSSTEIPTLPTLLDATAEIKTIEEDSIANEINTDLSEVPTTEANKVYEDLDASTELSTDKTTEQVVGKVVEESTSSLPNTDESASNSLEDRILDISTEASVVPTTEKVEISTGLTADIDDGDLEAITEGQGSIQIEGDDSISEEFVTKVAIEEDTYRSSTVVPTIENIEISTDLTADDGDLEAITEGQGSVQIEDHDSTVSVTKVAVEDDTNGSSTEKIELSTDLTADIDDRDLEAITEGQGSVKIEGDDSTVPPVLATSEESVTKVAVEEDALGSSTVVPALPTSEEDLSKTIEENVIQHGLSTEEPALPIEDKSTEQPTVTSVEEDLYLSGSKIEQPAFPTYKYTKGKNVGESVEAGTELPIVEEDLYLSGSKIEQPAWPNSNNIEDKATEASTELPSLDSTQGADEKNIEPSTEIPEFTATEGFYTKTTEDDVVDIELSTELPALSVSGAADGKDLEVTENPVTEEILTKTTSADASTSTEDEVSAASSEISALPALENTASKINVTKSTENLDGDLLAVDTASANKLSELHGSGESSTQNISEDVGKTESFTEQPTTEEAGAIGSLDETVAKVQELPTTEESVSKTAETDDDETTASVIIV